MLPTTHMPPALPQASPPPPPGLRGGYFAPAVLSDVTPGMRLARFAPLAGWIEAKERFYGELR